VLGNNARELSSRIGRVVYSTMPRVVGPRCLVHIDRRCVFGCHRGTTVITRTDVVRTASRPFRNPIQAPLSILVTVSGVGDLDRSEDAQRGHQLRMLFYEMQSSLYFSMFSLPLLLHTLSVCLCPICLIDLRIVIFLRLTQRVQKWRGKLHSLGAHGILMFAWLAMGRQGGNEVSLSDRPVA